ncbi:MAG: hypothetical protein ACT4QB_02135 [Gammaproteobacteria bacterium]
MTLTIEITPELESQVREQATRRGLGAGEYITTILREYLRHSPDTPCLPEAEAHLLQQINEGLPPELWRRYNELIAKRRAETLTPDERVTLIALSDQVEARNARRIQHLVELAHCRQMALPALMQQLGIEVPPHV